MLRWIRGCVVAACVSCCCITGYAADVPEDVSAAIKPAFERIRQAKTISADVALAGAIKLNGEVRQQMPAATVRFLSEAPNRLNVTVIEDPTPTTLMVSDGKKFYSMRSEKAFLRIDAPKDFAALMENSAINFGPVDNLWMPMVMAGNDPGTELLEAATKSELVDREKLEDRPAVHVRFTGAGQLFDLWLSTDEKPEILKLQCDMSEALKSANPGLPPDTKLEFLISQTFKKWVIDGKLPEDAFAFTPPKDAKGYDSQEELEEAMRPPPPLLGETAPAFVLATMEDKKFDFSVHKGKDVVLLDFWATWCGPCRKGLPIVAGVVKELAAEGVVGYAVNLQEDADTIKEFLKASPLDIRIAMDEEGKVAELFQVSAIPHTVLIGKDGLVQAVHIGFSDEETFKAQLTGQLKSLLKGESLLKKKEEEAKK